MTVSYDFNDPVFKKIKRYKRIAREHISISELKSDHIKWRATEWATALKIPTRYEVDFLVKSIVGIHEDQSPIYGNKHTIEVAFPAKFPLETFKAKAITNLWHPNIKWDGPMKGRICVNNQSFGKGYDLYWFLLRIGEIIQYKNYLAENIPPYPEDAKVAQWVLNYAEPNNIVNLKEKLAVDNSNLLEVTRKKIVIKERLKGKVSVKNVLKKGK